MKERLEKELEIAKNWKMVSDYEPLRQYYQGQIDVLEKLIKEL